MNYTFCRYWDLKAPVHVGSQRDCQRSLSPRQRDGMTDRCNLTVLWSAFLKAFSFCCVGNTVWSAGGLISTEYPLRASAEPPFYALETAFYGKCYFRFTEAAHIYTSVVFLVWKNDGGFCAVGRRRCLITQTVYSLANDRLVHWAVDR